MAKGPLDRIEGLLVDLDGVLYVGEQIIEGAAESILRLKDKGIPLRFTTNTTVLSTDSLLRKLRSLGLPIDRAEVFGAIRAAAAYLRRHGDPKCHLLLTDDPKRDFAEFPESQVDPRFVVVGDLCKSWDYNVMHKAFMMIMGGAEMVALHKGRYWQTEQGLRMDIGAFVAGLEYVTGKAATVIGKPSRSFFDLARSDMGLPADRVAMVGDDIDSDVGGAQAAGMVGILVKTGKYREEFVANSVVKPDLVIESIAELPDVLAVD